MALPGKASGEGGEGQLSRNGTTTTAMSVIQSLTEVNCTLSWAKLHCNHKRALQLLSNLPVLGKGNLTSKGLLEGTFPLVSISNKFSANPRFAAKGRKS